MEDNKFPNDGNNPSTTPNNTDGAQPVNDNNNNNNTATSSDNSFNNQNNNNTASTATSSNDSFANTTPEQSFSVSDRSFNEQATYTPSSQQTTRHLSKKTKIAVCVLAGLAGVGVIVGTTLGVVLNKKTHKTSLKNTPLCFNDIADGEVSHIQLKTFMCGESGDEARSTHIDVSYSFNAKDWMQWYKVDKDINSETEETFNDESRTLTIPDGGKIYVKNTTNTFSSNSPEDSDHYCFNSFLLDGSIEISGNVNSLINDSQSLSPGCFCELFSTINSDFSDHDLNDTIKSIKYINLPSLILTERCYSDMFAGCSGLSQLPDDLLPATTLAFGCYVHMFAGCEALTSIPSNLLPSDTLAPYCYYGMFSNCSGLSQLPQQLLSKPKSLAPNCYAYMFNGCSLTSISDDFLPATTLAIRCYQQMFCNCTSLAKPCKLPATTLQPWCYSAMFAGCSSLMVWQDSAITGENKIFDCPSTIPPYATDSMFYNINQDSPFSGSPIANHSYYWVDDPSIIIPTSINILGSNSVDTYSGAVYTVSVQPASASTKVTWSIEGDSLEEVTIDSTTGVLTTSGLEGTVTIKATSKLDASVFGTKTINVQEAALDKTTPLCFNDIADGQPSTIQLKTFMRAGWDAQYRRSTHIDVSYSFDAQDWTEWYKVDQDIALETFSDESTTLSIPDGGKIYVKNTTTTFSSHSKSADYYSFNSFFLDGSIKISGNVNSLINNSNLTPGCYCELFSTFDSDGNRIENNAIKSIKCINLPDESLADRCYDHMFSGCSGLLQLPDDLLPAKTLVYECYTNMFNGCVGLTTIPENLLGANELAEQCYASMFEGCVGLKTIPENLLGADTLAYGCYMDMFNGCTGLTTIPKNLLGANELEENCYSNMFAGCTGLEAIPEDLLTANTLSDYCYRGMFSGCTGLKTIPSDLLGANELAGGCYAYMFADCTGLEAIPEGLLGANTLANECYERMFSGCTGLKNIPENLLTANTLSDYCYRDMFSGCTGLTTIPENLLNANTLSDYCYASMFAGCTSLVSLPGNLLPATTLKVSCYDSMFIGCTSLTKLCKLPATTLVSSCYYEMFSGCTSLKIEEKDSGGTGDNKIFDCPSSIPLYAVDKMFADINGSSPFEGTPTADRGYYWVE